MSPSLQLGQPFDCIKTRLQVLGRGSLGSVGLPTHMVYNSALDCLRKAVSGAAAEVVLVLLGLMLLRLLRWLRVWCGMQRGALCTLPGRPAGASSRCSMAAVTHAAACSWDPDGSHHMPQHHSAAVLCSSSAAPLTCSWPALLQVVHEGPLSLYKGASAPLLGNMLLLGIHFPTFNKVRARLGQRRGSSEFNALDTWAAGGCAGAAGSLISSPSELVRTRMTLVRRAALLAVGGNSAAAAAVGAAAASEQYSGSWDCLRRVVRRHGLLGLYRGYSTTLLRDVQGYGWFFLAYEATVHAMLQPGQSRDQLSFNQIVTAGIMAGFGLWGSMFPIDTIKSKIQADSFTRPLYSGFRDCLRWTLASEGRAGLWRGASAAMLRVVPVNAAVFLAVEGTRGLLARQGQGSTTALAADRAAELASRVHA